jgi:transposase
MSKVRSVIKLYTEGVSKLSIGERTGLPRNTVKKYIRLFLASGLSLEEVERMDEVVLEKLFLDMTRRDGLIEDPRYQTLISLFPDIDKKLKRRENSREKLWKEYLVDHPNGYQLTAFKMHYRRWKKVHNSPMHIEHPAGEKMYVDYAGEKLKYLDPFTGEVCEAEVFVAILGASQLTYVEATHSQKKEDFIRSCENALHFYGGAPQAIVTDNLKSAVIKSNKYEPTLNQAFHDFVSHYTMAALPAGPYKPKHKALVEGVVKIIYRTIYGEVNKEVYSGLESLNRAIAAALEAHNNKLLNGRPYSRKYLFEDTERDQLQVLPATSFEIKYRKAVTVMKNNYVSLSDDKHYYSVPYRFIGKKVTLLYSQSEIEVYYHYERIALHPRNRKPFGHTTVEDHLASRHRFMSDWNPDKFIQRASEVGPDTKAYIIGILNSRNHPEQAYKSCQGVLSFVARVGKDRLNSACRRAIYYGDYGYHTIRVILEKGLDQSDPESDEEKKPLPRHPNIRGPRYYA